MQRFREWKDQHRYINKRDRQIKNQWKHGIVGVENPEDGGEVFRDIQGHKNDLSAEKGKINERRVSSKRHCNLQP